MRGATGPASAATSSKPADTVSCRRLVEVVIRDEHRVRADTRNLDRAQQALATVTSALAAATGQAATQTATIATVKTKMAADRAALIAANEALAAAFTPEVQAAYTKAMPYLAQVANAEWRVKVDTRQLARLRDQLAAAKRAHETRTVRRLCTEVATVKYDLAADANAVAAAKQAGEQAIGAYNAISGPYVAAGKVDDAAVNVYAEDQHQLDLARARRVAAQKLVTVGSEKVRSANAALATASKVRAKDKAKLSKDIDAYQSGCADD